jgi:DNA polymerase-3 subunit epsilon
VFPKASLQLGRVRIDGHFPCAGLAARKAPRPPVAPVLRPAASPPPDAMLRFTVKGRTDTYQVTAHRVARALRMTCSCQAGRNRIWCWHRTSLLDGVCDDLLSDNPSDLAKLAVMAAGADIEGRR